MILPVPKVIPFRWMFSVLPTCMVGSFLGLAQAFAQAVVPASEQASFSNSQSLDDVWWAGSLQANSAGTLRQEHVLVEPYLYDISSTHSHSYGSRTYFLYGVANRFAVGG